MTYLNGLSSIFISVTNWYKVLLVFLVVVMLSWGMLPRVALAQMPMPTKQVKTSIQPYLERVSQHLTEFRLDNGMKFIVLERHRAPVISFLTYADVGGVDEPDGKTGVAHFLEHLAFKGTQQIGTQDYHAEKPLLDRLDQLAGQMHLAQANGKQAEAAEVQAEFNRIESEAAQYVKQNELGKIVEQAGGIGLNASTSTEATRYFYNFPANKLELWMSLESERFLKPVFREFYKEKQVILEERRLRVENSPVGSMVEKFLETAYYLHPYHRPVIGYDEDIRNLTRQDVQDFFDTHYVPSQLTFGIVGDVNPVEVKQLAQTYFGRYPAKPVPPKSIPVEPVQEANREVSLQLSSQPWYLEGYHRPSINHPDHVVYEIIERLLSDGRTSRLYQSLVQQQQIALSAHSINGFPGNKYPNLMLFYARTAPNHTLDEVAAALRIEIDRLKTELVSDEELERVKTQARADLLRSLNSNMGLAELLVEYEVKTGSWRNLFQELNQIAAVTRGDIQRVAQATFTPQNRTIGRLLPK